MSTITRPPSPAPTRTAVDVRTELVRALRLDVIGPKPDRYAEDARFADERLPVPPSRWYLTGFLVPFEAGIEQRTDEASNEQLSLPGGEDDAGADENVDVDAASARKAFFPSSLGLSVLVNKNVSDLRVEMTWGDYRPEGTDPAEPRSDGGAVAPDAQPSDPNAEKPGRTWV